MPLFLIPCLFGAGLIVLGFVLSERAVQRSWVDGWKMTLTLVVLVIGGFLAGAGLTQWELAGAVP